MSTLGRDDWLRAALTELVRGGIEAVRVEVLARRLNVTKGSFYWHFDGRADLLDALLDWYESAGTTDIITRVDAAAADPAHRLRALADVVFAPHDDVDLAEPAMRAWASVDPRAAETLERVDRRRVRYVTDLLVATGMAKAPARRRADLFYRLLIGEFVWRSHGGEPLSATARRELVALLLS